MEIQIRETVKNALPKLEQLTEGIQMPEKGSLSFTTDILEMAKKSDFIIMFLKTWK